MANNDFGLRGVLDLNDFLPNVDKYVAGIEKMISGNTRMTSTASMTTSGLQRMFSGIANVAAGNLFAKTLGNITDYLDNMVKSVWTTISMFQSLDVEFNTILARDMANSSGGVLTVADALNQTSGAAQDLMAWVRQLAVTTPFNVQDIANTIAQGQAFGFTTEESKRLTVATGNFVSGMGLTNDQLDRIIYNFGQIKSTGKVVGQELRDLGRNFVPVTQIIGDLAKQDNVTFDQMKASLLDGSVSVNRFIESFVLMAERDFPNAMERMSRTLSGVQNNITDFINTVMGLELLGPVGNKFADIMANALDRLFQPDILSFFTSLGKALGVVFDALAGTIQYQLIPAVMTLFGELGGSNISVTGAIKMFLNLGAAINQAISVLSWGISEIDNFVINVKQAFGKDLGDVVNDVAVWGSNVVIAFANGMASAISAVFNVLNSIAAAFTSMLEAHSPPKLLPDLAKWGQAAAQSYVDAWGTADFSVFSDISGVIENMLRSVGPDQIAETDLIPRILGSREAIATALEQVKETGQITASALNAIKGTAIYASDAVGKYVTALFQLQKAQTDQTNASSIEGVATDLLAGKYVDTASILGITVHGIDDLATAASHMSGIVGTDVQAYVSTVRSLLAANDAVTAAEKNSADVTQYYSDKLQALNDILNAQTQQYDDNLRIQAINKALDTGRLTQAEKESLLNEKNSITTKELITQTTIEQTAAEKAAKARVDQATAAQTALQLTADAQKNAADDEAKSMVNMYKEMADAQKADIQFQIDNNKLIAEQIALLDKLAKQEGTADDTPDIGGLFKTSIASAIKPMADLSLSLGDIQDMFKQSQLAAKNFWDTVSKPFNKDLGVWKFVQSLWDGLNSLWDTISKIKIPTILVDSLSRLGLALENFVESVAYAIVIGVAPEIADITGGLQNFINQVSDKVAPILDDISNAFSHLADFLKQYGPKIIGIILDIANALAGKALEEILNGLGALSSGLGEVSKLPGDQIVAVLSGVRDYIVNTFIPGIDPFIKRLTEEWIPQLEKNLPQILSIGGAVAVAILGVGGLISLVGGIFSNRTLFLSLFQFSFLVGKIANDVNTILIPALTGVTSSLGLTGGAAALILPALGALGNIALFLGTQLIGAGIGVAIMGKNMRIVFKVWEDEGAAALDVLIPLVDQLLTAFGKLSVAGVSLQASPILQFFRDWFAVLEIIAQIALSAIIAPFVGFLGASLDAVTYFILKVSEIRDTWGKLIDGIIGLFTDFGNWFSRGFKDILTGNFSDIGVLFSSEFGHIGQVVGAGAELIERALLLPFGTILAGVAGFLYNVYDYFSKLFVRLSGSLVPEMMATLKDVFKNGFLGILIDQNSWLGHFLDGIMSALNYIDKLNRARAALNGTSVNPNALQSAQPGGTYMPMPSIPMDLPGATDTGGLLGLLGFDWGKYQLNIDGTTQSFESLNAAMGTTSSNTSDENSKMSILNQSFGELTTSMLFNAAAQGLSADDALKLADRMGLVNDATYDTLTKVHDLNTAYNDSAHKDIQAFIDAILGIKSAEDMLTDKAITITVNTVGNSGIIDFSESLDGGRTQTSTRGGVVYTPKNPYGTGRAKGLDMMIPAGFYENYPLGAAGSASSGERVIILPKGTGIDTLLQKALGAKLANIALPKFIPTAGMGAGVTNIDRRTYVSVDATYEQTAAPISVYHDVTAALGALL